MPYITPDEAKDEKEFINQFRYSFLKPFNRYNEENMDKEIELCNELASVLSPTESAENENAGNFWSSDRFQKVMEEYCQYVRYEDHIDAMITAYHEDEITAWEEADELFPNTRQTMPRQFYKNSENNEQTEDMNENEKGWHDYVNRRLCHARKVFEGMVPARMRRSYSDNSWL